MENKTAEQIIDDISFQMFKTDYKYIGLAPCKVMVLEEYINKHASLRSKELQEDLRVTENVKLSYLQAYNRECKRVDELTEEVDKYKIRIKELESQVKAEYERGYREGIRNGVRL